MGTALVTLPDGRKAKITFDSPEQLDATINDLTGGRKSPQQAPEVASDPSAGGGTLSLGPFDTGIKTPQWLDRGLAGAGKAFVDLGRGAGQLVGAVGAEAATEARALDKPLMSTGMGKVGNIVGGIAATVPALAVPGANTVAGAGVMGAAFGALQPAESAKERAINTGVGGAVGATSQAIGAKIAQWAGNKMAARAATAASAKAQNAVKDATLKEARRAGYVVPPSTTNPTAMNRAIEGVSGKAATQQSAAVKNQKITNLLVRKELGLPKDAPLTKAALNAIRSQEGTVYKALKSAGKVVVDDQYIDDLAGLAQSIEEVAKDFPELNIGANEQIDKLVNGLLKDSFDSSSAVEAVKLLRKQASGNLSFAASADPSKKALGLAQRDAAAAVEDMLIRHLESTGKGALAQRFDAARTMIAKTYSVEAALNEGSGNVVASNLANQLKRGKPLSGGLSTAAKFAQAFPKAAAEIKDSPGVSALDAMIGLGGAVTINPGLAALPLARIGTREALLSGAGQALAVPSYAPGKVGNALLFSRQASEACNAAVNRLRDARVIA